MKSDRQYRDAALGAFVGWIGIILTCLIMVIFGCDGVKKEVNFDDSMDMYYDLSIITDPDNFNSPFQTSPDTNWVYDSIEAKREADSVDAYMEYWYTVIDTNSNGVPDDIERWDPESQRWILIDNIELDKQTKEWTGTTQGEKTYEELLSEEPDYIYYDTTKNNNE